MGDNSKISKIDAHHNDSLCHSDWDLDSSANGLVLFSAHQKQDELSAISNPNDT
jgi:hypothetical protein